jgi:kynurenine formamidase
MKSRCWRNTLTSCTTCRFIHGGAWRDPLQDSKELQPALEQLLTRKSSEPILSRIAGFVSINYGLSTGDESGSGLDYKHPQHIQDVVLALKWLQAEYSVGSRGEDENGWNWMAVGHSCGATLALQLCMSYSKPWGNPGAGSWEGKPPVAVVGLEGIYDLPLLVQTHIDQPVYAGFVTSAFGPDENIWKEASPISGQYHPAFHRGGMKVVVLGHSTEDELVEWEQVRVLRRSLERQGWDIPGIAEAGEPRTAAGGCDKQLVLVQLKGSHDEVWSEGTGVRTAIEVAVRMLFAL